MFKTKNMEKWLYYKFEPLECRTDKDFISFARNLKAELNVHIKEHGCELVIFRKGSFFVSGFVYNPVKDKFMYFNVGDVRDTGIWHKRVLVREARNTKDYTGMQNQWTELENFGHAVKRILQADSSLELSA